MFVAPKQLRTLFPQTERSGGISRPHGIQSMTVVQGVVALMILPTVMINVSWINVLWWSISYWDMSILATGKLILWSRGGHSIIYFLKTSEKLHCRNAKGNKYYENIILWKLQISINNPRLTQNVYCYIWIHVIKININNEITKNTLCKA